jgi:hypothetical protein
MASTVILMSSSNQPREQGQTKAPFAGKMLDHFTRLLLSSSIGRRLSDLGGRVFCEVEKRPANGGVVYCNRTATQAGRNGT